MIRVLDVCMFGMVYGMVILYVSFEVNVGGMLVFVKIGDCICVFVFKGEFELLVDEVELEVCCVVWEFEFLYYICGYVKMYIDYVL